MPRYWFATVVALAGLALVAWLGRYTIVPLSGSGASRAYLLDRWTGTVKWLASEEAYVVAPPATQAASRP